MEFNQDTITSFYSGLYRGQEKHDSPELSRLSMINRITQMFDNGLTPQVMLNIGSGRQSLEKQLHMTCHKKLWLYDLKTVTVDIADIPKHKLLVRQNHIRSDALALPFADSSFGLVISNHAIDFLPPEAFEEARRILVDGGKAIFYFHHPSMIKGEPKDPQVRKMWKYLKANKILFENPEQIRTKLSQARLTVEEVELNTDDEDKWWEVVAKKT